MVTENIRDMSNWEYAWRHNKPQYKCVTCGHIQDHDGGPTGRCDNCHREWKK